MSSEEFEDLANIVKNDFVDESRVVYIISRISHDLEMTSNGLSNTQPFISLSIPGNTVDTMGEMRGFADRIYAWINSDFISYQFGESNTSNEEMVHTLETLHEGLDFVYKNLDKDKLLEGDYETIKDHWQQLMESLITSYPENPVFTEYYNWHYDLPK